MFGLEKLFGRQNRAKAAQVALYEQITQQSLHPWFYKTIGVEESFTGKFDLSVLHAHLVIERLRRDKAIAPAFSQGLFDLLFSNWDFALRESGVGDMSVGKHVKRLMQGFYGRAQAFTQSIEAKDEELLAEALRKNLSIDQADADQMRQLQAYVVGFNRFLWDTEPEIMTSPNLVFPEPKVLASEQA